MDSIFTKIIKRELPAYIIAENDDFIAFLDVSPLAKGHTLVLPKKQVDYIFDLPELTHAALWKFAKEVAGTIQTAIVCKRIGVAVIGLEVPHVHIHLVPLNNVEDINFSRPKLKLAQSEFLALQQTILQD
jgi:histidine triad (HIT) family protein